VRRTLVTTFVVSLVLMLGAFPAGASDPDAPEVVDVAGDGNLVNGQGRLAGHEQGPDARPASLDGADIRAVWFETAYDTVKVLDPGTGEVLRVEHRPTALVVRIKTEGPVHPTTPPGRDLDLEVIADLPSCRASFELWAKGSGPANDSSNIMAVTAGCGVWQPGGGPGALIKPAFDGAEVTLTFPLNQPDLQMFIADGVSIRQPAARSVLNAPFVSPLVDETASGSDFVIGEDVPPDVDCVADPDHQECHS
jgi:hypothetical protein